MIGQFFRSDEARGQLPRLLMDRWPLLPDQGDQPRGARVVLAFAPRGDNRYGIGMLDDLESGGAANRLRERQNAQRHDLPPVELLTEDRLVHPPPPHLTPAPS
jgi:hypothetical protein